MTKLTDREPKLLTPKAVRDFAKSVVGPYWVGQAKQTLLWCADLIEAADALRATLPAREWSDEDVAWLHKFINCVPFGADAPQEDIQRAHDIVAALKRAGLAADAPAKEPKRDPLHECMCETRCKGQDKLPPGWWCKQPSVGGNRVEPQHPPQDAPAKEPEHD